MCMSLFSTTRGAPAGDTHLTGRCHMDVQGKTEQLHAFPQTTLQDVAKKCSGSPSRRRRDAVGLALGSVGRRKDCRGIEWWDQHGNGMLHLHPAQHTERTTYCASTLNRRGCWQHTEKRSGAVQGACVISMGTETKADLGLRPRCRCCSTAIVYTSATAGGMLRRSSTQPSPSL
jgi:hypothetical protein